jgi:V/A-type H+-transporting ATPase subunit C
MSRFTSYQAINTKMSARKRAFLNEVEWNKLLNCESIAEVTNFLRKRYGYERVLTEGNKELHRTELETILNRYKVTEIEKFLHYFSGGYQNFFKIFLMQYEIDDLQLILRAIVRNDDKKELQDHFMHSASHTKLNYDKLLQSTDVEEFTSYLKGTPYFDALKNLTKEDATQKPFHMEMRLNMLYYKMLIDATKRLNKRDEQVAKEMIGIQIDYLNIQWIYRAFSYYALSKEEMLMYSLTGGFYLSYKKIKELIYLDGVEVFKDKVTKYMKAPVFKEEDDVFLERNIQSIIVKHFHKIQARDSIGSVLKYLYMLNIQIIDIISITEGIRYQFPKERITKYLVYEL